MVTPACSQCWKQAERCRTRCYLIKTLQFAGYSDIEFDVGRGGITQKRDRRSSVRQTATESEATGAADLLPAGGHAEVLDHMPDHNHVTQAGF